ncbi:MAG TPA: hypothetical protein VI758_07705 [Bacteroidota bacterium]
MAETPAQGKTLQWKWVAISFLSYVVFYLIPILVIGGFLPSRPVSDGAEMFLYTWLFAGIVIIAAVAAYLSPGVTIVEPAVAGAGLIVTLFAALLIFVWPKWFVSVAAVGMVLTIIVVFLLSLLGAWLGERIQWHGKFKALPPP